jgi:phage-related minor tail protein
MSNKIDILLNLDDNATRGLRKAEKEVQDFSKKSSKSFAALAAKVALVTTAVMGVVKTLNDSVKAAARQEDAINRLNAQLQLNGEFSIRASKELQEYASTIQRLTRFGDEAVLEQLSFAMAMGATRDQAKQVVSAATDMATALNINLNSAVRNISKTLGGYAGELGEVIPELKELTQEQLRAGKGIELLSSRYSGSAAADINTFTGRVKQLSNAWGDFQKKLGTFVTQNEFVNQTLSVLSGLVSEVAGKIEAYNIAIGESKGPLGELRKELDLINDAIERQQGMPAFLRDRNEVEERYNELLARRIEIQNEISRIQDEQKIKEAEVQQQETPEVEDNRVEKERETFLEILGMKKLYNAEELSDDQNMAKIQDNIRKSGVESLRLSLGEAAKHSKSAAKVQKGLAIGEAVVNTAVSVTNALRAFLPPANLIWASVMGAMGAAEIATIANQGFAEGTDTVPANLTPGEMVVPRTFAEAIRRGDLALSSTGSAGASEINIYIQGGIRNDGASVEEMAEQLGFEFERQLRSAR